MAGRIDELPGNISPLATRQAVKIGERAEDDIRRLLIPSARQAVRAGRKGGITIRQLAPYLSIGIFFALATTLAVMFGGQLFGPPASPDPTGAVPTGQAPTSPGPSATEAGPVAVLQWRLEGDRAVIALDQKYWEKYTAGTSPAGLYLRSDDINAFGDFLELHADQTFTLEERGTVQAGTWKVDGDQLTLLFSRSSE